MGHGEKTRTTLKQRAEIIIRKQTAVMQTEPLSLTAHPVINIPFPFANPVISVLLSKRITNNELLLNSSDVRVMGQGYTNR